MPLPGEPLRVTDNGDLAVFLQNICDACRHNQYCSVLAHAGMYGGANEWRTVDGQQHCIHAAPLPVIDRSTDSEEVLG